VASGSSGRYQTQLFLAATAGPTPDRDGLLFSRTHQRCGPHPQGRCLLVRYNYVGVVHSESRVEGPQLGVNREESTGGGETTDTQRLFRGVHNTEMLEPESRGEAGFRTDLQRADGPFHDSEQRQSNGSSDQEITTATTDAATPDASDEGPKSFLFQVVYNWTPAGSLCSHTLQ